MKLSLFMFCLLIVCAQTVAEDHQAEHSNREMMPRPTEAVDHFSKRIRQEAMAAYAASTVCLWHCRPSRGFPSVVKLEKGNASCTGTFVSDTTLITAAHCLFDSETGGIAFKKDGQLISSIKAFHHGRISPEIFDDIETKDRTNAWKDLAVVIFPKGSAPGISKIAKKQNKDDLEKKNALIVGYGITHPNAYLAPGAQQEGDTTIQTVLKEGLLWTSQEDGAVALRGDSGGPLLIDNEVVGVVSSSVTDEKKGNYHISLSDEHARELMKRATLAGADIPGL